MHHSVVKVQKIAGLSVLKLSFKVAFVYMLPQNLQKVNKNTLSVKKCGANKRQLYSCATKAFISAEAKKFFVYFGTKKVAK